MFFEQLLYKTVGTRKHGKDTFRRFNLTPIIPPILLLSKRTNWKSIVLFYSIALS